MEFNSGFKGLINPNLYRCLLKVLCPVSRSITALDCVLLKDNNRAPVAKSGPEINSQACLHLLQGPRHNTRCWFSIQSFIFLLIFCLETRKKSLGPVERSKVTLGATPTRKVNICSLDTDSNTSH